MTSLLCVQREGGEVAIHDTKLAETLVTDDSSDATLMPKSRTRSGKLGRPRSTPGQMQQQPTMDATTLIDNTMKMQDWLNEKTVMSLQKPKVHSEQYFKTKERNDTESQAIRDLYTPLLETEHTFVKQDMKGVLDREDLLNLRKRELLHKTWNDRVYEPIRRQILQKLDYQDWPEVDRRRRVLHKHYIEHVNHRGHVFLDTMDNGEYYAQALNEHRPAPIMVYTPELRDPLLNQQRERNREDQTILRCQTGNIYSLRDVSQVKLPPLPLVPLGRHGTSSRTWLEMPLADIESTPRRASRLRMQGNCTNSHMDFEAWSKIPFDSRIVDHEMQTQKKRMFEETPPYGIPPRPVARAPFGAYSDNDGTQELCVNI